MNMFNHLTGKVAAAYNQRPRVSFQSVCESRLSGFEIICNQKIISNVFLPDLSLCLIVVVPCFKFLKYNGKSHSYSGQPAIASPFLLPAPTVNKFSSHVVWHLGVWG